MKTTMVTALLLVVATAVCAQQEEPEGLLPFGIIIAEQNRAAFTLMGAGARATGMGGAFTAVADDATAASFNPAGLAQMLEPEASLVLNHSSMSKDRYRDFVSFGDAVPQRLTDADVYDQSAGFNFASVTFPFRLANRRWAVQVSQHRLVDFDYKGSVDFESYGPGGTLLAGIRQNSSQEGDISTLSGSLALELTQRTLVGITLNRWDGSWRFSSENARVSAADPRLQSRLVYQQTNSMRGWNMDIGLLLRYPRFSFGLRYRTPFDADYVIGEGSNLEGAEIVDRFETELSWPATLNAGVAVQLSDRWLVAADWGRTDWSKMEVVLGDPGSSFTANFFDLGLGEALGTGGAGVVEDWHLGTEYLFFVGDAIIPVRAGWFREPQPSRDLFTNDRLVWSGVSLGVGVKYGSFAFDVAVRYSTADAAVTRFFLPADRELTQEELVLNSIGLLERSRTQVIASMIIQFPKDSAPRGVLRKVFGSWPGSE